MAKEIKKNKRFTNKEISDFIRLQKFFNVIYIIDIFVILLIFIEMANYLPF